MTRESTRLPALGTTTATVTEIATMDDPISDHAPGARRRTETAAVALEKDLTGLGAMRKVLAGLIQASRLHLSSTVPRLPNKHGMIPPTGAFLWLKPKLFQKTLLNLIKVLRMSAWPRRPRICI